MASVALSHAALAQSHGNIHDYLNNGFLELNAFSVPLIHGAFTGEAVQTTEWLNHAREVKFTGSTQAAINTLRSGRSNEFEQRSAQAELDPLVARVQSQIRKGKDLLLVLEGSLETYDFKRSGFPLKLALPLKPPQSVESYHCTGANGFVKAPKPTFTTSCVTATNLAGSDPALGFYAVPDQGRAQMIRQRFSQGQLAFAATVEQDGKYKPLKDGNLRYGGFLSNHVGIGLLPVRITTLIVFDRQSGELLDVVPATLRGVAATPTPAPTLPSALPAPAPAAADVLFRFDGADPGKPGAPTAAAPPGTAAEPLQFGAPRAAATRRMSQLLSLLSYTVYTNPERIAQAQRQVDEVSDAVRRSQADDGHSKALQALETADLEKQLAVQKKRLQQLLAMQGLKAAAQAQFGATFVEGVSYKDLYYERFSLADGRSVVVYRGTSNMKDLKTDMQLVLSPQAMAAWHRNSTGAGGDGGTSGLDASASAADKDGNPANFQAAVETIDRLVHLGIRPDQLLLAGHSLGGGYATYAGYKRQVGDIMAFNPAPLNAALRQELQTSVEGFKGRVANFVAYLPPPRGGGTGTGTLDPVSQRMANYRSLVTDSGALQVLGPQYVIEICDTRGSPAYRDFQQSVQRIVDTGLLVLGGLGKAGAKAAVITQTDKAWDNYNAHKMQNLYEALQEDATTTCTAKKYASN